MKRFRNPDCALASLAHILKNLKVKRRLALLGTVALAGSLLAAPRVYAEDVMKISSAYPFSETIQRLSSAFQAKGMTIFAIIDHQAAARSVGLDMPPTRVIIYGSPAAGTPLMLAAPDFAIELPLRVLVREEAGKIFVVFNRATAFEGAHGLTPGMAAKLAPVEQLIAHTVEESATLD